MENQDKNLKNLKILLAAMSEDHLSKEDFVSEFEKVVNLVKQIEANNIKEFESIHETLKAFTKKIEDDNGNNFGSMKMESDNFMKSKMDEIMKMCDDKLCEMDDKMLEVKDGEDADEERILENLKSQITIPTIEELKDDLPKMGAEVRDALELLQGEDRLDVSAIKGLEKTTTSEGVKIVGGSRGIQLLVEGSKKGLVQTINLIGGSGITLAYNRSNGRNDITISGGGGSLAVLPAAGAVNDSNTSFTFGSEPTLVIVNGATYRDGHGCSISGTNVTLDNPVGTGGDIYGLG